MAAILSVEESRVCSRQGFSENSSPEATQSRALLQGGPGSLAAAGSWTKLSTEMDRDQPDLSLTTTARGGPTVCFVSLRDSGRRRANRHSSRSFPYPLLSGAQTALCFLCLRTLDARRIINVAETCPLIVSRRFDSFRGRSFSQFPRLKRAGELLPLLGARPRGSALRSTYASLCITSSGWLMKLRRTDTEVSKYLSRSVGLGTASVRTVALEGPLRDTVFFPPLTRRVGGEHKWWPRPHLFLAGPASGSEVPLRPLLGVDLQNLPGRCRISACFASSGTQRTHVDSNQTGTRPGYHSVQVITTLNSIIPGRPSRASLPSNSLCPTSWPPSTDATPVVQRGHQFHVATVTNPSRSGISAYSSSQPSGGAADP